MHGTRKLTGTSTFFKTDAFLTYCIAIALVGKCFMNDRSYWWAQTLTDLMSTVLITNHFTHLSFTVERFCMNFEDNNVWLFLQLETDICQPPLILLDFLPLAGLCNSVLASLNAIRLCAPISLASFVASAISGLLADSAGRLAAHYALNQTPWGDTQRRGYLQLCFAFKKLLLPYLAKCLSAVFPPRDLAVISGLSVADLQACGLGFLDLGAVLGPLADLLRPLEEEEAAMIRPSAAGDPIMAANLEESAAKTEYVADKMADLVAAVESCDVKGPKEEGSVVEEVEIDARDLNVEDLEQKVLEEEQQEQQEQQQHKQEQHEHQEQKQQEQQEQGQQQLQEQKQ